MELQLKYDTKAGYVAHDDVLKLYASSWFSDTDTGVLSWGPEDNDGAAIGASDPDSVALDFTP
jgi:hypothetical protein